MSRTPSLYISADSARVRSFSASSRASSTVVKIELEISDARELGYLLDNLQSFRNWKPEPVAPPRRQRILALPAPGERGE